MNISEEKLLDFIEGQLDEDESKEVIQAIENDPEIEQQYKVLLEGNQLIDEWYKNEVANAPDASKPPIISTKQAKEKIINFWSFIPQFNVGGLVGAASFAFIAFIGGSQISKIIYVEAPDSNNEIIKYSEIDLNSQQIALLENENIQMRNNKEIKKDWTKEEWHINNNIAISLVSELNGNKIFLNPKDKVGSDQNIQLMIQVFKEALITIQIENNSSTSILFTYEDINIKPSDIFITKKFKLNNINEIKKIIIHSKINEKTSKSEFLLN